VTIEEAKQAGQCQGCVFRLIGPGETRCMGVDLAETECPGKCADEKHQEGDGKCSA